MNIIRQALAGVQGHWCKDEMRDGYGNYCGLGHVARLTHNSTQDERFEAAAEFMNAAAVDKFPNRAGLDSWLSSFANFNDHGETSEADVMAVMELAADRWDVERSD